MRVKWMASSEFSDASPFFKFTDEERAVIIGALRIAAETDTSAVVSNLLHLIDQIDRAVFAMAGTKRGS